MNERSILVGAARQRRPRRAVIVLNTRSINEMSAPLAMDAREPI
jgi:hypothetical protein